MRWIFASIMAFGIALAVFAGWHGRWGMMIVGIILALFFGIILVGIYAIEDKRRDMLQEMLDERRFQD